MLARSSDRGQHWKFVATIAVDPNVGTEGFGEPVIVRVSRGPNPGRLICQMRTGRELYEAVSDNEGATWTPARPRVYASLDTNRTELWVDMFRGHKGKKGKLDETNLEELPGAVVDPDLIELRDGSLVAGFGVRGIPSHGNYIAFSLDQGKTWTQITKITAQGDYVTVREISPGKLFFVYDRQDKEKKTYVVGRMIDIARQ